MNTADEQRRLTVHQACMQAAHPERLNRWFLTERPQLAIELTEQREIGPRNSWKHEEHT